MYSVDEVYVNAGLKGRGNHGRIILLGRRPRCMGLRAGRGGWNKDVIPVFTIVGRNGHEVYIRSRDVSGETVARIASRHIETGSRIYTDNFPSYSILQGMGYRHEYANNSLREYTRGNVHINNCESRASILRQWLSAHRDIQGQSRNIPKPPPTTEKHKQ
jgi:transposase-like protein